MKKLLLILLLLISPLLVSCKTIDGCSKGEVKYDNECIKADEYYDYLGLGSNTHGVLSVEKHTFCLIQSLCNAIYLKIDVEIEGRNLYVFI